MSRVVVAMSGGVDSSVAAALVRRQGHEAVGVTLQLLPLSGIFGRNFQRNAADAEKVCKRLGIPHHVVDAVGIFERHVIAPFVQDYLEQRTPNPCVECNRFVKFGHLMALACSWDAAFVATGHYARIEAGRLLRALDPAKDQSYFLYKLTGPELQRILFPVGAFSKTQVRGMARELGLETAQKQESMEICFIPDRDYRSFVRARSDGRQTGHRGPIRDSNGMILGDHQGLENYTIGQRRGLGLSCPRPRLADGSLGPGERKTACARSLYVTGMDAETNTLFVGPDSQTRRDALVACRVSWVQNAPAFPVHVLAQIRHRHPACEAIVSSSETQNGERSGQGRVVVKFSSPQRAMTPGQAVVFYRQHEVLGGGVIEKTL